MNDIKADIETLKAMSKYFRDSAFIPWADALDRAIQFIEDATAMLEEATDIELPDGTILRRRTRYVDKLWHGFKGDSVSHAPTAIDAWKELKK
jgi:hypothetical protein